VTDFNISQTSGAWRPNPFHAMDIQIVMKGFTDAKELISSVMEEIRKAREAQ
jgi:hypothetical protein